GAALLPTRDVAIDGMDALLQLLRAGEIDELTHGRLARRQIRDRHAHAALVRPSAMARPRPRAPPVTITARSDGATPMDPPLEYARLDYAASSLTTSTANEALRRFSRQIIDLDIRDPREGLRRRAAPMLGFAFAGVGSGQKSVLRAGETRHEVRHLRLHRRARRDAAADLRGSACLAAGGRGRRLLRLSSHRASRDAVVDDAVAQCVSGRRRARNTAHPPRHAALSLA